MANIINALDRNKFDEQMLEVIEDFESSRTLENLYRGSTVQKVGELFQLEDQPASSDKVQERKRLKRIKSLKGRVLMPARRNLLNGAYRLYTNAYNAALPCMVIGNAFLRTSEKELVNFGALSDGTTSCPRKLRRKINTETGSILNDGKWSILKNDAYIFGSIHGEKTFYVFTANQENGALSDSIIWDDEHNRPRVAGREIIMLYEAGYRQVAPADQVTDYGATLVSLDSEKAQNISFKELVAAANKISSVDEIRAMLEQDIEDEL